MGLLEVGSSATRKGWTWVSGDFTLGDVSQKKRAYRTFVTCSAGSATQSYATNGSGSFTGGAVPVKSLIYSMQLKLVGTASTVVLATGFIYRSLMGKR